MLVLNAWNSTIYTLGLLCNLESITKKKISYFTHWIPLLVVTLAPAYYDRYRAERKLLISPCITVFVYKHLVFS